MEKKNFTFLICSNRAPKSLEKTLESIAVQQGLDSAEVVLINNGFSEKRESVIKKRLQKMRLDFRIFQESKKGLAYARRLGFYEAKGDYLILLDDDNFLADDFLVNLQELVTKHSDLGGVCPRIYPEWEKTPESWLEKFGKICLSYNAISKQEMKKSEKIWSPEQLDQAELPPGGGMIVHRRLAQRFLEHVPEGVYVKGDFEGRDVYYSGAKALGYQVCDSSQLKVFHWIPVARTTFLSLLQHNYQLSFRHGQYEHYRGQEAAPFSDYFFRAQKKSWDALKRGVARRQSLRQSLIEVARAWGRMVGRQVGV